MMINKIKATCLMLTCLTVLCGMLAGCRNVAVIGGADGPTDVVVQTEDKKISDLYAAKNKYIGDASADGKILSLLGEIDGVKFSGIEIKADKGTPFGLIRNCNGTVENKEQMARQAAIFLALVENADYVTYVFENAQYAYSKQDIADKYGKDISKQAESPEAFAEFYKCVFK